MNVEIRDDLSALIDESTFEFMSSSHNATVSIDSSRMISFYFEDINLPDSTTNEPMSKGYVKFRVALVSGVLPNDIVNNQARIYFDNNPPIYTNTTENILNCFILPAPVNLTYSNQQILTNIIDPNMTFVWSLNGDILVGETNSFVDVTLDGTYTVVVSNQYGCQTTASYNYVFSDLGIHANQAISAAIYPNPSKAEFGIYFAESGTYQLSILDESGRLIFADEIQENNSYIIDGATLPVGVYFVKLTNDMNETSFYRIVKL
ncbi:MAG: T9SS type A sorting domain-containing protein [Crocinitomicaceae bacterium]|nr:T9SS type A sorting domain-containing protein [Crocinitomicaceae bacterium]